MDIKGGLNSLHEALVQVMLDELAWYKEENIPVPAADKQAIIALLKHNAVAITAMDAEEASTLKDALKQKQAERKARKSELLANSVVDLSIYQQVNT